MNDLKECLQATDFLDFTHPLVSEFVGERVPENGDETEKAVQLYYAVRDGFRYDPYMFSPDPNTFKASFTIEQGRGWCVPKAALLAASCRAAGIPAKLGFADVKNHMSTARLREMMQTDVFAWHGYTSIYLNHKWIKATPAFNIELCEKFGLKPLEFNGLEDSLYHEFDQAGNKHMEYMQDRGEFTDVPLNEILTSFEDLYGGRLTKFNTTKDDFQADVDSECSVEKRPNN